MSRFHSVLPRASISCVSTSRPYLRHCTLRYKTRSPSGGMIAPPVNLDMCKYLLDVKFLPSAGILLTKGLVTWSCSSSDLAAGSADFSA